MKGYEAYQDDAASSSDLAALATFADELSDAELEVARIEDELKKAKGKAAELADRTIPELMDQFGMKTFTTTSGLKIDVRRTIRASIPAANKVKAMAWLDDNGHSGLIKRNILVAFDRESQDAAHELKDSLGQQFENVKEEMKVEPSTLRAFIGEQLKAGEEVPLELFGAWEQRTAKITAGG
jgi:hypothetical protein